VSRGRKPYVLASEQAAFATGRVLQIDGGVMLTRTDVTDRGASGAEAPSGAVSGTTT